MIYIDKLLKLKIYKQGTISRQKNIQHHTLNIILKFISFKSATVYQRVAGRGLISPLLQLMRFRGAI